MADIFGNDGPNTILTPPNGTPDNIFALGGDDIVQVDHLSGNDNVDGGTGSADYIIAMNSGTFGALVALGDRGVLGMHDSYLIVASEPLSFGTLTSVEHAVGGFGDDALFGSSGDNVLHGGPTGNDLLEGGLGADSLEGYDGIDTAGYFFAAASVFVFLNAPHINGGEAAGDTFISIENLDGSAFGDLLSGDVNNNKLTGNDGADFLAGNGGSDNLVGGAGDDILAGGVGNDAMNGGADADTASYELATAAVLVDLASPSANTGFAAGDSFDSVENLRGSFYHDTLKGNDLANVINGDAGIAGEAGNDQLFGRGGDDVFLGGPGADMMSGGNGFDSVDYVFATAAVRASLLSPGVNTGLAAGDAYVSVEGLLGAGFADDLTGDNFSNRLTGRAGNDRLFGGGGSDILIGGLGLDLHDGGSGIDTADYSAAASGLVVDLTSPGSNTGEAAGDTYVSIENVTGSAFFDVLRGNAANNAFDGGADSDTLLGLAGADALRGAIGDDVLDGGSGADALDGGAGSDVARYSSATAGVVADLLDAQSLNSGDAAGDAYTSIEDLEGSAFDDVLRGDGNANRIHDGDGGGRDVLMGRGGNDVLTGTAGDDTLEGGEGGDSLQGGGNSDTASYAGATEQVEVYFLAPGNNRGEAFGDSYTLIENILGSLFADILEGNDQANRVDGSGGDDQLRGFAGNDTLLGGAGADTLIGGLGFDTMTGGLGDDRYVVDGAASVMEALNAGVDTVQSLVTHVLAANVENLVLTGIAATNATGNALANNILGNGAANILNGGAGADNMSGGGGNDRFFVDNAGDMVTVPPGGGGDDDSDGSDRVLASVSYVLPVGQAIETLSTTNNAGATAINLTGNVFAQAIIGNAGANIIDGRGGSDVMQGLAGNDWYYVDAAGDRAVEAAGKGSDRVLAALSFTLEAGSEVELLRTTNDAGTAAINLTGSNTANQLLGNAGANQLNGRAGADIMQGLGGNDWYFVDNAGDRAVEAAGKGSDRVFASVSFTLEAGSEVELIRTTNDAGTAAINLTGGNTANHLLGNAGANQLNGRIGADIMQGLGGNDWYYVDNVGDRAVEAAGKGADRVLASISFALEAGSEIETFTTTNNAATTGMNLTGNAFANLIIGNAGQNIINGGLGADIVYGLGGPDHFLFNTALNAATNVDSVRDFNVAADFIRLENAVFSALAAGGLPGTAFRIGPAAADASDRIIYNSATGALIYDSNGNGAGGATQFATLSAGLGLSSADFIVI